MQEKLNKWADKIQSIDDFGEREQQYNELWDILDTAGGLIDDILHGEFQ